METGRLIPFARRSGSANMAIDEFMIAWQGRTGRAVARVYGWDPAAITIGRYQDARCVDRKACMAGGVDVVRRITGGGAIFHDREITYAIACGESALAATGVSVPDSFRLLNGAIIAFYEDLGLAATYPGDEGGGPSSPRRAHFCFAGRERYDLIIEGKKIGGNAQRRVGGAIFQHGSIPIAIDRGRVRACFAGDTVKGEYSSLNEALGREINVDEASGSLIGSLERLLGITFSADDLDREEIEEIEAIMERRYLRDRWNIEGDEEAEVVRKTILAR